MTSTARLDARLRRLEGADMPPFAFVAEGAAAPASTLWRFDDPGEAPSVEAWAAEAQADAEGGSE